MTPISSSAAKLSLQEEVNQSLAALNITICADKIFEWRYNNKNISVDKVVTKIRCYRNSSDMKSISRDNIMEILDNMEMNWKQGVEQDFLELIRYDSSATDTLPDLLNIICGEAYDPMYIPVLKQVLWTIKSRYFNNTDYNPILLNIYGEAGVGKTYFLTNLFKIFPKFRVQLVGDAHSLLSDSRFAYNFIDNYVLILNELSGVNRTDLNSVKNTIDSKTISYRRMGKNANAEGLNNAQLISTSNTRLKNTLLSDHDIRKWAEIDMISRQNGQRDTITPLENFNYLNLWRSINENDQSPFADETLYNNFKSWTTEKCGSESVHQQFLEDFKLNHEGKYYTKIEFENLYEQFLNFKHKPLSWGLLKEKAAKSKIQWKHTMKGDRMVYNNPNNFLSYEEN